MLLLMRNQGTVSTSLQPKTGLTWMCLLPESFTFGEDNYLAGGSPYRLVIGGMLEDRVRGVIAPGLRYVLRLRCYEIG